jgi:hypothetical protein
MCRRLGYTRGERQHLLLWLAAASCCCWCGGGGGGGGLLRWRPAAAVALVPCRRRSLLLLLPLPLLLGHAAAPWRSLPPSPLLPPSCLPLAPSSPHLR